MLLAVGECMYDPETEQQDEIVQPFNPRFRVRLGGVLLLHSAPVLARREPACAALVAADCNLQAFQSPPDGVSFQIGPLQVRQVRPIAYPQLLGGSLRSGRSSIETQKERKRRVGQKSASGTDGGISVFGRPPGATPRWSARGFQL
jgi:hypothetical protein